MSPRPRLLVMSKGVAATAQPSPDAYDLVIPDGNRDAFLRAHGRGIEVALASGMERFDAARFDLLPDLRLIAVIAAGMAGIDLDAARTRGVAVTNAGELNAGDVADYAVAMLLAVRREVIANDRYVREDRWPDRRRPPGRSIAGERVGIVGLGHIGRAVAERMAPFGCKIAWWGRSPKPDSPWRRIERLEALAAWATTLVVAVAGNDDTRGLVSADAIEALGPDGLIVNVARGFVIDQPAMIAALKDGRLGAAALDVFEPEPIKGSDWADVPNVLFAPHVAGGTDHALAAVIAGALENVRRHFAGEPLLRSVA